MDLGGPTGIPEDQRITIIGNKAMLGETVGVLVEDPPEDPGKPDRYIAKVIERFPGIELVYRDTYLKTEGGPVLLLKFRKAPS